MNNVFSFCSHGPFFKLIIYRAFSNCWCYLVVQISMRWCWVSSVFCYYTMNMRLFLRLGFNSFKLQIMASSLNGLTVGDSLPDTLMDSPARSENMFYLRWLITVYDLIHIKFLIMFKYFIIHKVMYMLILMYMPYPLHPNAHNIIFLQSVCTRNSTPISLLLNEIQYDGSQTI